MENVAKMLSLFLKELDVNVSNRSVLKEFEKHPFPTSLLAVSEILNTWGIASGSFRYTQAELLQIALPTPFIAHIIDDEFWVVTDFSKTGLQALGAGFKKKIISHQEFEHLYTGTILIAEKEEDSREINYSLNNLREKFETYRIPFLTTCLLSFLVIYFLTFKNFGLNTDKVTLLAIFLFKTIGLVLSILLLAQTYYGNNSFIKKICGTETNQNCNAVLSSDASKLFSWLSWSEIGFFYFAGTWLALFFQVFSPAIITAIAILNLFALPYTFYSFYYQWKIRQFCVLCSAVQLILWLEFFELNRYLTMDISKYSWNTISILIIVLGMPIVLWFFIKPLILSSKQLINTKKQLHKFKFNKKIFTKLLEDEPVYALLSTTQSLVIANNDKPHTITIVSNPFCQPCANAHSFFHEWLSHRDDIRMQLVFPTSSTEQDETTKIVSHLLNIQLNDPEMLNGILNEWYDHKYDTYEDLANAYPVKRSVDMTETLTIQNNWCRMANITGTPTIFINGRQLPSIYDYEDIQYLL